MTDPETRASETNALAFVESKRSSRPSSRPSPKSKSTASVPSKVAANTTPKTPKQQNPSGKSKALKKPHGHDKPSGLDLKTLGPRIAMGIGTLILLIGLYFFMNRKRDYSAERQTVLSHISSTMPKAKFDSWGGEGIAKGCTKSNGVKLPDDGVVVLAHVKMPGKLNYVKDIVFIVLNGRVTDEFDRQDFRRPAK